MSAFLLLMLIGVASVLTALAALHWVLAESEDGELAPPPKPLVVTFFDARIWNAFRRWGQNKPLALSYRRDRRGRFRKLR